MSRIRIILTEPEQARNIGAVVRIAANFALADIYLVRDKPLSVDELCEVRVASAGAIDLVRLHERESLREALHGASIVVGTSARRRDVAVPTFSDLSELLQKLPGAKPGDGGTVAILFGRESQGLSAAELSLCHGLLSLPVSENFPSMNLSHAVAVVLCQCIWTRDKLAANVAIRDQNAHIPASGFTSDTNTEKAPRELQERWLERIAAIAGDSSVKIDLQQLRYLLHRASPGMGEMALLFNLLKLHRDK